MTQIEAVTKRVSWWASGSRPIWLVVMFWLMAFLTARPAVELLTSDESFSAPVALFLESLSGFVAGQLCFLAVVSGLRWRSWSAGYAIGIVVASVGLLALVFAYWFVDEYDSEGFLWLALIPTVLLTLAFSLMVMRYTFGWRLVARDESVPRRDAFRMEDLFALTAIAAANLALLRFPQAVMDEDAASFWFQGLIACGMVFAIGLFVLPMCVRLALGTNRRLIGIAGLLLIALLVTACIAGISSSTMSRDTTWSERAEVVKSVLAVCGGASVSLYASLFVLARGGMSLVRAAKSDLASRGSATSQQTCTRWLTAAFIAVAVIVSIGVDRVVQHRHRIDAELERLSELAKRRHGGVEIWERRIQAIQLGRGATDNDFDQFPHGAEVSAIDLSNSSVTDSGIANLARFPNTQNLMLNGTSVSDEGLAALRALDALQWVALNRTNVTGSGFRNIGSGSALSFLELGHTRVHDATCGELCRFGNLSHLSLAGTRVTDEGLEPLQVLPKLRELNANQTAVTGEGVGKLSQLQSLSLAGTKVDDRSLSDITGLQALWRLDLSDTTITDAGLKQLRELPALGELSLADTPVTGGGFRDWNEHSLITRLDLSRTAFRDENVKFLRQLGALNWLDLSDTELSNACLPDLDAMRITSLNLSHTRVTARALLAADLAKVDRLELSSDQGTEAEMQQLDLRIALTIVAVPEDGIAEDGIPESGIPEGDESNSQ